MKLRFARFNIEHKYIIYDVRFKYLPNGKLRATVEDHSYRQDFEFEHGSPNKTMAMKCVKAFIQENKK